MRARLLILDRDLAGFAVSISAIAQWLDQFWNDINPRADGGDFGARVAALDALDLPTVVFPLQYAPLCEGRRIEAVTYRAWMIAVGEVKPRPGEQKHSSAALTEAIADASTGALAATRAQVAMIKASLGRIREIFMTKGCSPGLETLAAQVDKLQAFIDPRAAIEERATTPTAQSEELSTAAKDRSAGAIAGSPASLAEAQQALAAISDYYSRSEPSSPTLPLVRQAHQLIGKSFFEVMSILVPTQMEKAAFQIGAAEFFELPVGKLSKAAGVAPPSPEVSDEASPTANPERDGSPQYRIEFSCAGDRDARTSPAIFSTRRALEPGSDAVRSCARTCGAGFHGRAEGSPAEGGAKEFRSRKVNCRCTSDQTAREIRRSPETARWRSIHPDAPSVLIPVVQLANPKTR